MDIIMKGVYYAQPIRNNDRIAYDACSSGGACSPLACIVATTIIFGALMITFAAVGSQLKASGIAQKMIIGKRLIKASIAMGVFFGLSLGVTKSVCSFRH
jgi:hypothetical protein